MKRYIQILLLVTVLLVTAGCQGVSTDPKPFVAVNGSGQVKAAPDTVQISITVASEERDATAQTKNAEKVEKIVAFLKEAGLEEQEIKTIGANFYPNKRWEDGREVDLGFRAENFLQVETKKLDLISIIIDGSVQNGAERISGLNYILSNEGKAGLQDEIIAAAVNDAREQAEATATSLGKSIDGVKSVIVVKEYSSPIYRAMDTLGMGGGPDEEKVSTPILPGELDYNINVAVEFFIK